MPILNYTTKISPEKTAVEIHAMLSKAKVQAILNEYDNDGMLCGISFRIMLDSGPIFFKLPARIDSLYLILQAARLTWRILKNWIEAQLAIVEVEQAQLDEVFLPYAQDIYGKTVYERIKNQGYRMLSNDTS